MSPIRHRLAALSLGPLLGLLLFGIAAACGGSRPELVAAPVPQDDQLRDEAIADVGQRIYAAIAAREPTRLLVDDEGLRRLVDGPSATRLGALRLGIGARLDEISPGAFEGTAFSGVCLQGARVEAAGGTLGLLGQAWVFDRALVSGSLPGGRRLAAWVEGLFVYTSRGFVALDLHRVEDPRWEHSDLEIATCDMEVRAGAPQDIGMVTQ